MTSFTGSNQAHLWPHGVLAWLASSLALLVLTGISECQTGTDSDGDGWTAEDGDCDDSDASTHPGAEEPCDGIDHDCDGAVTGEAGDSSTCAADSCSDILEQRPDVEDGLYWIDLYGSAEPLEAWCDMTLDNGGWTLLQVGLGDGSADLRTDDAVGTVSSPTQTTSAKLSRAAISAVTLGGDQQLRYGHPDYGWIYLVDLEEDWITTGFGSTGYGVDVNPYTAALSDGGETYPGSRFSWPVDGVPQSCPNSDGSTGECGAGLHLGTWGGSYPDGVYMNYSTIISGASSNIRYQLWAR